MTTVADLVAKLGFQVDTRGFDNFKKSLEAFQSTIREGLKDLKEYAKQAEKIGNAVKNVYLPSRQEAEKRFKAETYSIRARAYAQRVRAKYLPETLSVRRYNAEIRDRQTALKEAGIAGGTTRGGGSAILSILGMLSGGVGGVVSGGLMALGSAIGGPVGAAVAMAVSKLMGSLIGALMKGLQWIWGQIKQGLAYAMSFRDYRSFTGRSSKGLNNLMGMTKYTTSMTPEDVMKDATRMGREYWDLWFGGGNPAIWQLLGILPTMNGETNLKNLLSGIYGASGGGKNRGLALSLLKQAGLSDDYMNIFDNWAEYKAGGGEKTFLGYTDEQIKNLEEANKSLREFGQMLDQVRVYFVDSLLKSGIKDVLQDLANYLLGLIHALRAGKIHDFSSLSRHLFAFDQMVASGISGRYISRSEYKHLSEPIEEQLKKEMGYYSFMNGLKNIVGSGVSSRDISSLAREGVLERIRNENRQSTTNINQRFDFGERNMQDAVNGAVSITQKTRDAFSGSSLSNDTVMVPTF